MTDEPVDAGRGPGERIVTPWVIGLLLVVLMGQAGGVSWQLARTLEGVTAAASACPDSATVDRADPSRKTDSALPGDSMVVDSVADSPLASSADTPSCAPPGQRGRDLFVLALLAGALGGLIHSLRSFVWYVGNRDLRVSWIPRYLALPVEGAMLSAVVYLLIRAGFMGMQDTSAISPYGIAGVGALMGLFSQAAILKLKQVAETVFLSPAPGADNKPQQAGEPAGGAADAAPAPTITAASRVGDVLKVTGTGFRTSTKFEVNGQTVKTWILEVTEATCELPVGITGPLDITATTPPPGGGTASLQLQP